MSGPSHSTNPLSPHADEFNELTIHTRFFDPCREPGFTLFWNALKLVQPDEHPYNDKAEAMDLARVVRLVVIPPIPNWDTNIDGSPNSIRRSAVANSIDDHLGTSLHLVLSELLDYDNHKDIIEKLPFHAMTDVLSEDGNLMRGLNAFKTALATFKDEKDVEGAVAAFEKIVHWLVSPSKEHRVPSDFFIFPIFRSTPGGEKSPLPVKHHLGTKGLLERICLGKDYLFEHTQSLARYSRKISEDDPVPRLRDFSLSKWMIWKSSRDLLSYSRTDLYRSDRKTSIEDIQLPFKSFDDEFSRKSDVDVEVLEPNTSMVKNIRTAMANEFTSSTGNTKDQTLRDVLNWISGDTRWRSSNSREKVWFDRSKRLLTRKFLDRGPTLEHLVKTGVVGTLEHFLKGMMVRFNLKEEHIQEIKSHWDSELQKLGVAKKCSTGPAILDLSEILKQRQKRAASEEHQDGQFKKQQKISQTKEKDQDFDGSEWLDHEAGEAARLNELGAKEKQGPPLEEDSATLDFIDLSDADAEGEVDLEYFNSVDVKARKASRAKDTQPNQ